MVKALTDRLKELNATAAEFQVMVDEGEKKLRDPLTKASTARGEAGARRSDLGGGHDMAPSCSKQ